MPKLKKHGKNTLEQPRVLNIDPFGVWILVNGSEYFLEHEKFPWFVDAKISDIFELKQPHLDHLRWDSLDVDLDLQSLKNPEKYPLIAR